MPSTQRLSPSPSRSDRPSARGRVVASVACLALFGTGCPQLLDDDFAKHHSTLSADASVGGECGAVDCSAGGAGGKGGSGGPGGGGAGGMAAGGGRDGVGGDGGGAGDAAIVAELRSCPFGEPEPLAGLDLAMGSQWGPSLTADGLTLYFAQGPSGDSDLYRATRSDRGQTFSTPVALTNLNTNDDEGTPFISADGRRLYFYSTRAGGPGGKDLYVATRSDVTAEFPSGQLVANVNSAANDHLPRLSRDELTLWFTSTRSGGPGAADLWTASRASAGAAFGTPSVLGGVNGSSGDESGGLTQDGLVLVFDSTRDGVGNSEIFIATRASTAQSFPSPTALAGVNSTRNEYNVFLTLDERELFFASNRTEGSTHQLFRALRRCD